MDAEPAPQDTTAPTPEAAKSRPSLTQKQRDRLREIQIAHEAAEAACHSAEQQASANEHKARRALDDAMSSKISAASKEQIAASGVAAAARAVAHKEAEAEYRRAISAAESARSKSRSAADAQAQAAKVESGRLFSEATAPVETWYVAEKAKISAETDAAFQSARSTRDGALTALRAAREAIESGKKQPEKGAE